MNFERKQLPDGQPNPKYVDLLDEDQPIAGQKFGVFSFITPFKILKQKELFFFTEFVKQWDFVKSMSKFLDFLNFISYKYNIKLETLMNDYQDYLKEESAKIKEVSSIEDDYFYFVDKNEENLEATFHKNNQFQTSVLGFKSRGHFPTEEEARQYAKKLRERDPNHNIHVGPVGIWLPMDPDPLKTGSVEFMEEELNKLHQEKLKNQEKAKEEFERRILEAKRKAIAENVERARQTGNKLTQTITEDGQLIGVNETVDFESREVADPENAPVPTYQKLS